MPVPMVRLATATDGSSPVVRVDTAGLRVASARLVTGGYYLTSSPSVAAAVNSLGNGTLRLAPWVLDWTTAIDRIGGEITVVGEAGSKLRLGIYADNGTGYPGALVVDAGQIAGDVVATAELTVALTLDPGLYWIGGAVQSVVTTQPTVRVSSNWTPPILLRSGSIPSGGALLSGYSQTGVTGALPANFTTTVSGAGSIPRVFVRAA